MIDLQRLKELLTYYPDAGVFVWSHAKVGKGRGRIEPGTIAGSLNPYRGYIYLKIDQRMYSAHRLAYFYVNGAWPADEIDHINGDKTDNRINNLRPATRSQNGMNTRAKSRNTSGIKGVDWNKKQQRWRARIRTLKGRKDLGGFLTKEEAAAAYARAAHELHGEFAKT